MSNKLIQQLMAVKGLEIECPNCDEQFSIKQGKLFNMYEKYTPSIQKEISERIGAAKAERNELKIRRKNFNESKKARPQKILVSSQASNFGQISEQIIPAFLTFPYTRSECRILFKPIDYIVFENLSKKSGINRIKFVDVKTGKGRLDARQRQIAECIDLGKIKHRIIK